MGRNAICIKSFVEVVKFSLTIPGVSCVVATKLNQNPLEKLFGKLQQKMGAYGAFNCKEFTQNYSCAAFNQNYLISTCTSRQGTVLLEETSKTGDSENLLTHHQRNLLDLAKHHLYADHDNCKYAIMVCESHGCS